MLISRAKKNDKEILLNLKKTLAVCARMYKKTNEKYWEEEIAFYQKHIANLEERIATHDYTEDDAMLTRVDNFLKRNRRKGV